jgi:hypothetical protein
LAEAGLGGALGIGGHRASFCLMPVKWRNHMDRARNTSNRL